MAADGQHGAMMAVDLGGTKLDAALVDLNGTVLVTRTVPTDPTGAVAVIGQIAALAGEMLGDAEHRGGLAFCQVGAPGVPDAATGAIRLAPNIPGLDAVDVVGSLSAALQCPAAVENDVATAMFGEFSTGAARGSRHAAFVSLGTGIGCGLIVDGRLLRGASGAAGEIAYLPLGGDPATPEARITGALELAVGSAAMRDDYRRRTGAAQDLSVREIFARAEAGDTAAGAVLEATARHVSHALLAIVALIDPDCIVLGGSIGVQAGMVDRVRQHLEAIAPRPVDLRVSAHGARAGLMGAIAIGLAALGRDPAGFQIAL